MKNEVVRANPQARQAAKLLAQLKLQQGQRANPSFTEEAFEAGRRAFNEGLAASEQQYREAHDLPSAGVDGIFGELLESLAKEAIEQFAVKAVANTESQLSQDTAASIEQAVESQRRDVLKSMFSQSGELLETSSGPRVSQSPIEWFVHYTPTSGTICLQAVSRADHTLEDVVIRIHSRLSRIRSGKGWTPFTIAVPSWEPGKSVVVSGLLLTGLRLTKTRGPVRSDAKWSSRNFAPGDLVATVYSSNGYYLPQDLRLLPKSSPVGRLDVGDEQESVVMQLKHEPFICERQWLMHGETKVVQAKIVARNRSQVTLSLVKDDRTEVIPLRIVSAEDRKYLRSLAGELGSLLQLGHGPSVRRLRSERHSSPWPMPRRPDCASHREKRCSCNCVI